jgi:hypothetical protein
MFDAKHRDTAGFVAGVLVKRCIIDFDVMCRAACGGRDIVRLQGVS